MKLASLRLFALLLAASFLPGCSPVNSIGASTNSISPSLAGDWSFIPFGQLPLPNNQIFSNGSLAIQGNTITGTFQALGGCVSSTFDIAFTGSLSSIGILTLSSTNLPNNIATIVGSVTYINGGATISGTIVITGTGACALASYNFVGVQFQSLTGNYVGTLYLNGLNSGASLTVAAFLTEAPANADGQFPVTGSITASSSTCSNVFSVSGVLSGQNFTGTVTSASAPNLFAILVPTPQITTSPSPLPLGLSITSSCAVGDFAGNLTKQ